MSFYSVVDFIREHYPEYYGLQTYPKSDCVQILRLQDEWGRLFLDALKFCLVQKYRQCELLRQRLEASRGKSIVENQDAFPKKNPDAWGVKSTPDGIHFKGPNLQGRLLMELRSAGTLEYRLPPDALDFIRTIQFARG